MGGTSEVERGTGPWRPRTRRRPPPARRRHGSWHVLAEDPALDLATVVLERVVQVHHGRVGRRVRLAVPDGAVDGVVLLDRLGGVPTHAADADHRRLLLQPA